MNSVFKNLKFIGRGENQCRVKSRRRLFKWEKGLPTRPLCAEKLCASAA